MVLGETRTEVIANINDLIKTAKSIVLKINKDKTKYLVISRGNINIVDLIVGEGDQAVNYFKYLLKYKHK